jgi:hypothetical protein
VYLSVGARSTATKEWEREKKKKTFRNNRLENKPKKPKNKGLAR